MSCLHRTSTPPVLHGAGGFFASHMHFARTHTHTHTLRLEHVDCGHTQSSRLKRSPRTHTRCTARCPPFQVVASAAKPGCCSSGVKSPSPKWLVCLSLAFSVSVAAVKKPNTFQCLLCLEFAFFWILPSQLVAASDFPALWFLLPRQTLPLLSSVLPTTSSAFSHDCGNISSERSHSHRCRPCLRQTAKTRVCSYTC